MIKSFLLFVFSLVFLLAMANAQFQKGDKMAGTSIGSALYNMGNADVSFPDFNGYTSKSRGYTIRLEPAIGWFISEKTVLGASLNINPSGEKISYENNGSTFQKDQKNSFNIGIGGFARNYFGAGSSFLPFGQFGFNLGISSLSTEGFKYFAGTPGSKNSYDGKSSGDFFANATLEFGLTKMLGESTGLDLFIGYNYSYNKNTVKTTTSTDLDLDGDIDLTSVNEPTTKFTNHGFIIGAGFQVFINRKK